MGYAIKPSTELRTWQVSDRRRHSVLLKALEALRPADEVRSQLTSMAKASRTMYLHCLHHHAKIVLTLARRKQGERNPVV